MSRLLEILGMAMSVSVADLIEHWLQVLQDCDSDSDSKKHDQLQKVIELLGENDLKACDQELRLYMFDHPDCIRGHMAAAAFFIHDNQLIKAVKELKLVYTRQPSNTMALYALGYCHERLGEESKAIEYYQDCLKFKNYLQMPRQRLAAIYFKNGQLEKTIQEYRKLQNEYPEDVWILVTLGYLYIANGKFDTAKDTFNTAILVHPDNFTNVHDQIDQLIRTKQYDQAMEQIENLLNQQPENAELLLKQADIMRLNSDTENAILGYNKVISVFPNFLEAHIKLGTMYLQLHQEKLAAKQFNKASEINDQIVDSYIGLSLAQKLAGQYDQCCATLSLAAAIQPNSSLLFTEAAVLKIKSEMEENLLFQNDGKPIEFIDIVIQSHKQQIAAEPQNPELYYRLGILMMNLQRYIPAIECFQKALELNPMFTRAKSKLIVSLLENAQAETALDYLQEANFCDKGTLDLHYKIALLYCNRRKFASSLMNLERHVRDNNVQATVNISLVLQNIGLLDRASAMWDNLSETTSHAIITYKNQWEEEF